MLHEFYRKMSGIALDQAHEHNNCLIKSDGGVIGITENESALLRWMTSGPAICQLIQSFSLVPNDQSIKSHHEDIPSVHKSFFSDVKQLADTIEEIGNPFLEDSKELVSLDSNLVSKRL